MVAFYAERVDIASSFCYLRALKLEG